MRAAVLLAVAALGASACQGLWNTTPTPSPVRAVHVALLRTGKVLLVAGSGQSAGALAAGDFRTSIWDPATNTFQSVATPWDAFCAGHAFLPDGKLLVAGGTSSYGGPDTNNSPAGLAKAYTFDPTTSQYQAKPNMAIARWYPTVVELGNGTLFTVGGLDERGVNTNTSQIFNGSTWSAQKAPPAAMTAMPMYAGLHLMADGRLFYSGANVFGPRGTSPGLWNVDTNAWKPVPGLTDAWSRDQATSVLLPPAQDQKVMIVGGGTYDFAADAVGSTAIVDLKQANPTYVAGPPMSAGKMYVSAVILPDSTVLQTGGAATTDVNGGSPVFNTQIFNPKTSSWREVAPATVPRSYHSSALLLPDGRVATFGGNPGVFEMRIEIYTPPYLQTGTARPTITSGPTELAYGGTYSLGTTQAQPLRSAVLVRPSAVTHSLDADQRLVDLPFTTTAGGISFSVTSNRNLAPPGWYMLFAVDKHGVPSVAKWVHLT